KIAGDQLEQCRLARAVTADDANALTAPNHERYVLKSGSVVVFGFSPKPEAGQPEDIERLFGRAVVQAIDLGNAVEHHGRRRLRHSPRTQVCLFGKGESRERKRQAKAPSSPGGSLATEDCRSPSGSGRSAQNMTPD